MTERLITPLEEIAQSEVMLSTGFFQDCFLRIVRYGEGEYDIGTETHQPLWIEIRRKNNPEYRIARASFFYLNAPELTLVKREGREKILLRIWRDGYMLQNHIEYHDTREDLSKKTEYRIPFASYWKRIRGSPHVTTSGFEYSECNLCDEIEKDGMVIIDGVNHGQRDIYKSKNFIVKPALGPLVEGHVCIFTEKHYLNMGKIPEEMHPELEEVIQRVECALQKAYNSPSLFFEHGPAPGNRAGCCIDHAHIHAMPIEGELKQWIPLEAEEIAGLRVLSELARQQHPYLFFQENNGQRFVIKLKEEILSQYVRRVIASHKGFPQADWRQDLNLPCVFATYQKMRRAMNN